MKIIHEPTAAAIAFGNEKGLRAGSKIMIFDLGGGTFDVSILDVGSNNYFTIKATEGDMHLGGEDFNQVLIDYLLRQKIEEGDLSKK